MLLARMSRLFPLRRILARALFAWAALILSLGPSMDAVAGAAKASVEAGHSTFILEAVASFDVIDDPLDHFPGKSGEPQQQHVAVPLLPSRAAEVGAPFAADQCVWIVSAGSPLASCTPEGLERPPRA